ncbi:hypothetical protein OG357_19880 [Streptomyces sp. NBC_01255]|uniref:hypothetical protein n=1 Tax=Streptomyces sp. NBC_01255 TaxID=2903798 RepID=UPI002E3615E9|nr:hypothetical protein [Streptomyces sp. NBC_01255]
MRGGLLVGLLVLPCLALPGLPGAWAAGGVGDGALRMTVTVNGRGHSGLRPPAVRVGAQVVKRYRLVNSGEAHLYGVRVVDPAVPAGAVRCPGRTLAALGELECVARFPAVGGVRRATARVEGDIPSLRRRLTATARTGYTGVAGGLRLTERVTVPGAGAGAGRGLGVGSGSGSGSGAGSVGVAYTVTNRGNRAVHAVRVEDPGLGLAPGSLDCGAGGGTVAVLAPGASARCTAVVRRPPGTHRSTGIASGSDRVTTYGPGGERLLAPTLTARSSAVFTLPRRASVAAPKPNRPGSGGAPGGSAVPGAPGGVGVAGATGPAGPAGPAEVAGAAGAPAIPGGAAGGTAAAAGAVVAPGGAGVATGAVPVPAPPPPPPPAPPAVGPDGTQPVAGERPGTTTAPAALRAAAPDDEGFLGRLRRRGREAHELGIVITLLLLLIPAAIAAALLGNRRG